MTGLAILGLQGGEANGINGAVEAFVKDWNIKHPYIQFQYVKSCNEDNLDMKKLQWFCSEPKLAIEFSKIKRANSDVCIVGQNNWAIAPWDFSYQQQDACDRVCQGHQQEMVNFNRSSSPLRISY